MNSYQSTLFDRSWRVGVLSSLMMGGLALVLGLSAASPAFAAPTSQPAATSKPVTSRKQPTSRPVAARPLAPQQITLQIAATGDITLGKESKTPLSLTKLLALAKVWKAQKPRPEIIIKASPKARHGRVVMVLEVLKELRMAFRVGLAGTSTKAKSTQTPPAKPAAAKPAPTQPTPARPAPKQAPASDDAGAIDWAKIPLNRQFGLKAKQGVLELRGQVLLPNRAPKVEAALALIAYKQGKRSAVGVLRSNKKGLFRLVFLPELGVTFRVSILHDQKILEFPVQPKRQVGGKLYLRLVLTGKSAPVARVVAKRQPAKRLRPSGPKVQAGVCDWKRAPKIRIKMPKKARPVEIRLQVRKADGRSPGALPTGLILRQGKRALPTGRGKTSARGCLVYIVDGKSTLKHEVAVLDGVGLRIGRVPAFSKAKAAYVVTVNLPRGKRKSTAFEELHTFFQAHTRNPDWLQVTHVASIFYSPASRRDVLSFVLPVAKGAVQVQTGRELSRLRPSLKKDIGLQLKRLKPGPNRFLYGYLVPRNSDLEATIALSFAHKVSRVTAYYAKGEVLPKQGREKLKKVTRGSGKHKREFLALPFPPSQANQVLTLTVVPKTPPPSGLLGWISRMKRKRKRNKLIGLGVLLGLSGLGLFWLVSVPRRREV